MQYSATSCPSLTSIQRPCCPKCGERMRLERMASCVSAFEIGTFECVSCRPVHAAAVETDPMTSNAVLWLVSHDLKPPI